MRFFPRLRLLLLVAPLLTFAAAAEPPESLAGVIDFHCHSAPDTVSRSINSFDVVRQAKAAGMRAVVLKNHFVSTAALAQLAQQEVGGIEVFGGIVLNRAAGGLNAEAVRRMTEVEGNRGRVVWLPTYDAENQVRFSGEARPFVAVVQAGKPVPPLAEIFKIVAEKELIFATGHSSPEESIILLQAARAAGVKHLLVTHVLSDSTHATLEQMRRMVALGAVLEFTWLAHLGGISGPVPTARASAPVPIAECVRAIQAIGAEHFLLSTDLGQKNNPVHTEGLRAFVAALRAAGITQHQLDLVTRQNPAQLLGLIP